MAIAKIREILAKNGRLSTSVDQLADDSDLYNAGLTSLATVGVMLALEEEFNIEIPDSLLGRKTFQSIQSIADVVNQLKR
ncbi:MAG: acyl carrier protein [Chloroflexi bacterium]|nr:acyl carrier protein [Chloroflexota bacterium]